MSVAIMRIELEQKLVELWPSWFNVTGDQRETRMTAHFASANRFQLSGFDALQGVRQFSYSRCVSE